MNHNCFSCDISLPAPFLDLGSTPLANSYLTEEQIGTESSYPLAVTFCDSCKLVQLTDYIEPKVLFSEYAYFSSYSDSYLEHAKELAITAIIKLGLNVDSLVMEVGSNDGYLLKNFVNHGIPVLGFEPASNIAAVANNAGITTRNEYFDIYKDKADLIIANNVLAHVPDITYFLKVVKLNLKSSGAAVFEFPYLAHMLDKTEYDTIYHEHVFYYSLTTIKKLLSKVGLQIYDIRHFPHIHGGTLRVLVSHIEYDEIRPDVIKLLEYEQQIELLNVRTLNKFADRVKTLKKKLVDLLSNLKSSGNVIAAYGAPAKGNTLLNYCKIDNKTIDFTVDRSPHKQGLYLPGSHIPIYSPEKLVELKPNYTLILPWNLTTEIVGQQKQYLDNGGKFIVPIPDPKII